MSAVMTPAQRRAELEQQIAQDARAQCEAKLAALREAEKTLQEAYERRAVLERQLEDGELAREESVVTPGQSHLILGKIQQYLLHEVVIPPGD